MRVLALQKVEGLAGSERYLLNLLPGLVSRGVAVTFLQVVRPKDEVNTVPIVRALQDGGVTVRTVNYDAPLSLPLLRRLNDEISAGDYDLVHSNLIHADIWVALIKMFWQRDMCVVSTKHGYDEAFQTRHGLDPQKVRLDLFSALTRFAGRWADHVIAVSDGLRRLLAGAKLVSETKISVIPLGLSFERSRSAMKPGEARYGSPQLVIVGRLVPVKQHALLFQVLPGLLSSHPGLKLVVVGGGPLESELRRKSAELGLADHIVFTGTRDNVHDFIRDSDVVLVPSSSEGFGAVILEGWYNAKPVVAFDVPAPNEIITHEQDGILVPAFDLLRLQNEISRMIDDADLRSNLGLVGQETYRDRYTPEAMVSATLAIYQKVLAGRA